jgi:hypothetical protein
LRNEFSIGNFLLIVLLIFVTAKSSSRSFDFESEKEMIFGSDLWFCCWEMFGSSLAGLGVELLPLRIFTLLSRSAKLNVASTDALSADSTPSLSVHL